MAGIELAATADDERWSRPWGPPSEAGLLAWLGQVTVSGGQCPEIAAFFSRGTASARTAGFTPAACKAARKESSAYRAFRLFHSVLRFCPKESFKKLMNSSSGHAGCRAWGSW